MRDLTKPQTNWIVGKGPTIPLDSLRAMGDVAADQLCVKWFQHHPQDPVEWGLNKPISEGRTLSILTSPGLFHYSFEDQNNVGCSLTLDQLGEFVIWGAGLAHSWRVLQPSTILTIRWNPLATSSFKHNLDRFEQDQ